MRIDDDSIDKELPAKTANYFWQALKNRDVKEVFDLLSAESKGFLIGYLHCLGVINARAGAIQQQLEAEEVQAVLKSLLDDHVKKLPLDHVVINQPIYSETGVHAACKMISKETYEQYSKVVFLKPTGIEAYLLPMVCEIVEFADQLKFQWRVDWIHFFDK